MEHYKDFDKNLYALLRKGNEYAFTTVFDKYNRLLYVLAYRFLKSGEEAEDAVQHVFMKLWEHRESFDFESGLRSLLFTILKNYILNELRHRHIVFEKHYELAQEEETTEEFLKNIESRDLKKHLWKAIEGLPPQKRKICRLKLESGLSNQDIADQMHITVASVKSHYTQAIKTLKKLIEPLLILLTLIGFCFFNK